jgi:hypothetical protein
MPGTGFGVIFKYFLELEYFFFSMVPCDECGKEFETKKEMHAPDEW